MSMYSYKCNSCEQIDEVFFRRTYSIEERNLIIKGELMPEDDDWARETAQNGHQCECCGCKSWMALISNPKKHSSWDSTGGHGVNGYFSTALGRHLSGGINEERKIMEERGFIAESDLPKGWWDEKQHELDEKNRKQAAYETQYKEALQNGKSKEEAVAETWTSKDINSGELDKVYDTSISTDT